MKNFDFKKVMEWLGFVLRCPICSQKYSLEQARVIETEEEEAVGEARVLVHSDCKKCKSSVMFNIEIRGPEVFSVGMVTDLTHQDSTRLKKQAPISVNEVIGVHREIRGFKGDFLKLFGAPKTASNLKSAK